MGVTTAQTYDVAQVLADLIGAVDDIRVVWWISDASRPPVAIIAQPEIDYADPDAPFCFATWLFPVAVVVNRNNDRDAQRDLSRLVNEVVLALDVPPPDGVHEISALTARPTTVAVSGQDLPAYELRVRVRA
jgi:hypothetical protein